MTNKRYYYYTWYLYGKPAKYSAAALLLLIIYFFSSALHSSIQQVRSPVGALLRQGSELSFSDLFFKHAQSRRTPRQLQTLHVQLLSVRCRDRFHENGQNRKVERAPNSALARTPALKAALAQTSTSHNHFSQMYIGRLYIAV